MDNAITSQANAKFGIVIVHCVVSNQQGFLLHDHHSGLPQSITFQAAAANRTGKLPVFSN